MLTLCFMNLLGKRGIGILPRNLGAEEYVCKGLADEGMVRRREHYCSDWLGLGFDCSCVYYIKVGCMSHFTMVMCTRKLA